MIYNFRFRLPRPILYTLFTDLRYILVGAVLLAVVVIWFTGGRPQPTQILIPVT